MNKFKEFRLFKKATDAIIFFSVLLVVIFTVYGFLHLSDESDNLISSYVITAVSFGISVIALIVALKTFFSIDSVNSITSMDGNVLQNENYSVSYFEMINEFDKIEDKKQFMSTVFDKMWYDKKSTQSCIEYTDWLQRIIDNLIWLAYVDKESEEYKLKSKALTDAIDSELDKYRKLSNGIQYILQEHVKLIKNVMSYIKWSNNSKLDKNSNPLMSKMEDIRGKMIQNPISKIVYYDYLGLSYHKKAKYIISEISDKKISELNDRHLEFYEDIKKIVNSKIEKSDAAHIILLLEKSMEALNEALSVAKSELLWEGYIRFNLVRVKLLKDVITGEYEKEKESLLKEAEEVVKIRENVRYLYSREGSYIYQRFTKEITGIEEVKEVMKKL